MRYKKFLLIPILIIAYVFFINLLIESASFATQAGEGQTPQGGSLVNVGISASASVSVVRPYLFGLLELPVYTDTLGDISPLHDTFFAFIVILTIVFMVIEWRKRHEHGEKVLG